MIAAGAKLTGDEQWAVRFFLLVILDVGASIAGAILVTTWCRVIGGGWPDRARIFGLIQLFLGIGALGIVSYVLVTHR